MRETPFDEFHPFEDIEVMRRASGWYWSYPGHAWDGPFQTMEEAEASAEAAIGTVLAEHPDDGG